MLFRSATMLKKSLSLTSRTRKFVIGLASAVTAAIGLSMTPQVTFAAVAITPSDYYANFNGSDQYVETGNAPIATAGDFTAASSIGKSLYTSGAVPGAAGGLFIAGTNAATTITTTSVRAAPCWRSAEKAS